MYLNCKKSTKKCQNSTKKTLSTLSESPPPGPIHILDINNIHNEFLSGNLWASRKDYWFFPKNSAVNLGTFFFYKDIFIYHINLEELKKTKLGCVYLYVFKDMVVERSKHIQTICPNLLHFKVNCTFWRC